MLLFASARGYADTEGNGYKSSPVQGEYFLPAEGKKRLKNWFIKHFRVILCPLRVLQGPEPAGCLQSRVAVSESMR